MPSAPAKRSSARCGAGWRGGFRRWPGRSSPPDTPGLYTSTPDSHPVLDRVEGVEGLYVCTGFSGHGFKLSPAVGLLMAELILDGQASTIDIHPLRQSRFAENALNLPSYGFKVLA